MLVPKSLSMTVAAPQIPAAHSAGHQRPHTVFVSIAFLHDGRAHGSRERVHLDVRGCSFDFADDTQHMRGRQVAQPRADRPSGLARNRQCSAQPVQRSILTEVQNLILALEIVVQVSRRKVRSKGDLAHPGRRVSAPAKHTGGRAQNFQACLGPPPSAPLFTTNAM